MDEAEKVLGIRFRKSYRAFIDQFGPGEIGGYFRIYAPHISSFPDYGNDILEENRNWRDPEGFWATTAQPELVSRLVCFAFLQRLGETHAFGIRMIFGLRKLMSAVSMFCLAVAAMRKSRKRPRRSRNSL